MTVRIEDTCTACGLCCDTCPEVFEMGDDKAQVIVDEVPAEFEDAVQQAADECPSRHHRRISPGQTHAVL